MLQSGGPDARGDGSRAGHADQLGLHPRPVPVNTTLRAAGIESVADQRVDRLSGGQTQRVRFALAIAVASAT